MRLEPRRQDKRSSRADAHTDQPPNSTSSVIKVHLAHQPQDVLVRHASRSLNESQSPKRWNAGQLNCANCGNSSQGASAKRSAPRRNLKPWRGSQIKKTKGAKKCPRPFGLGQQRPGRSATRPPGKAVCPNDETARIPQPTRDEPVSTTCSVGRNEPLTAGEPSV